MRITSCVSCVCATLACAATRPAAEPPSTPPVVQREPEIIVVPSAVPLTPPGDGAREEVRTPSGKTVVLPLEGDVYTGVGPEDIKVIAEVGSTLVVVYSYDSVPGGMSYCQAGRERFLRVFALRAQPEETLRIKLESCWQGIEVADEGRSVQWHSETSTLHIEWLSGPFARSNSAAEELTLRLLPRE